MSAYIELTAKTEDILEANNGELRQIIDKAVFDMISDTMSRFKNNSAPRKITINLELVRIDEIVNVKWKVDTRPAAYEKTPEDKSPKVPKGQTELALDDSDPITGEIIDADFEEIREEIEK